MFVANNRRFPERVSEVFVYENSLPYNSDILRITARDGDITAESFSNTEYPVQHDEGDIEYWIAHVLWWYDIHDDNAWTVSDVTRAAQLCQYACVVLPKDELIKYCGISQEWGVGPYSYDQMITLYRMRHQVTNELAEGAD